MPKLQKIIGLTGMSGSGKSTVCGAFREHGFSVIDCDAIARKAAEIPEFLAEISERFSDRSDRMLNPDGSLNRPEVARLIYHNESAKEKYQRIIFPYIIYNVIQEVKNSDSAVLLDAPTLFESKLDMICTKIVSVCASESVCANRISVRDNITPEQAMSRISAQHTAKFFHERSDYFIENDGAVEELNCKAEKLIDMILKGGQ